MHKGQPFGPFNMDSKIRCLHAYASLVTVQNCNERREPTPHEIDHTWLRAIPVC